MGKDGLPVFFPHTKQLESSWHVKSMSMSSLMLCPHFDVHPMALIQSSCQSMLKRATFTKHFYFSYQLTAACFNWPSENLLFVWAKTGSGTFKFCKITLQFGAQCNTTFNSCAYFHVNYPISIRVVFYRKPTQNVEQTGGVSESLYWLITE